MNLTEILLAVIAIASAIVSALIVRFKAKRERNDSKEDKLYDFMKETMNEQKAQIAKMQDGMITRDEFVKKEEIIKANEETKNDIKEIKQDLKDFARMSIAVDSALITTIRSGKTNGELTKAEQLINEYCMR